MLMCLQEGKVQTYDMKKVKGGENSIKEGAASTIEMTDAIIAHL